MPRYAGVPFLEWLQNSTEGKITCLTKQRAANRVVWWNFGALVNCIFWVTEWYIHIYTHRHKYQQAPDICNHWNWPFEVAAFVDRKWSNISIFILLNLIHAAPSFWPFSFWAQGGVGIWNSVYMWAPASKLCRKRRRDGELNGNLQRPISAASLGSITSSEAVGWRMWQGALSLNTKDTSHSPAMAACSWLHTSGTCHKCVTNFQRD